MPAVYLPPDAGSIMGDLQDRVRRLETFAHSPPQLAPDALVEITGSPDLAGTGAAALVHAASGG
jgi:hypothetical protein